MSAPPPAASSAAAGSSSSAAVDAVAAAEPPLPLPVMKPVVTGVLVTEEQQLFTMYVQKSDFVDLLATRAGSLAKSFSVVSKAQASITSKTTHLVCGELDRDTKKKRPLPWKESTLYAALEKEQAKRAAARELYEKKLKQQQGSGNDNDDDDTHHKAKKRKTEVSFLVAHERKLKAQRKRLAEEVARTPIVVVSFKDFVRQYGLTNAILDVECKARYKAVDPAARARDRKQQTPPGSGRTRGQLMGYTLVYSGGFGNGVIKGRDNFW